MYKYDKPYSRVARNPYKRQIIQHSHLDTKSRTVQHPYKEEESETQAIK